MSGDCPHCGAGILVFKGGKAKMRTNILVVHESGRLETNCPSCKKPVELPVEVDSAKPLRKAVSRRFGVQLDRVKKSHA